MKTNSGLSEDLKKNYLKFIPLFKEEKTQRFMTLVLTIVAFSFFGFFAINPTLSTIAQLKKELSDNQFVDQKLDEKIKNLSILSQKYNLLQEDIPLILSAIPQTPSFTVLTGQIQTIALINNVAITRMQTFEVELPKKAEVKSEKVEDFYAFSNFIFSLGVEGTYPNLLNILNDMINFDRIITIDSMSVNKNAVNQALQLDIKGKTYFKP